MAKRNKSFLKTKQTFTGLQVLIFVLVFVVVGTIAIIQSLAAPGGNSKSSGSGTISLVMVKDLNSDGQPNQGDTITFNVSTSLTTNPYVTLYCYQNSVAVLHGTNNLGPNSLGTNFTLASNGWTSGAADCTAYLQYYSHNKLTNITSLSFHVNA